MIKNKALAPQPDTRQDNSAIQNNPKAHKELKPNYG